MAAAGNPHNIQRLADLPEKSLRLADRQQTAGSYLLFSHLLEAVGLSRSELRLIDTSARCDYFEPSFQRLLVFTRMPRFVERAKELGGYDAFSLGRVIYNAP